MCLIASKRKPAPPVVCQVIVVIWEDEADSGMETLYLQYPVAPREQVFAHLGMAMVYLQM